MNEITHIHLGRQPFAVAVDAHRALRAYLAEIEHQVGKNKDVIEEVELRMAELLRERGITSEKVVLTADVEYLKKQLGEPSDFTDDEKTAKQDESEYVDGAKRLFRDPGHGMVAGVAAGLAAYLRIDPFIVRLVFILLTFFGGTGVLLYALFWLLVPPVRSGSDRLQMKGLPVTVENIKEAVSRADVPGVAGRTGRTIGRMVTLLGKMVLSTVGISFIVSGIALLMAAATVASFAFVHGYQMGGQAMFPVGGKEVLTVVAYLAVLLVIAVLAVLVGRAMIRRKWGVPGWALAALVAVFIAGGAIGAATSVDAIPVVRARYEKVQHSEWRPLPAFSQVHAQLANTSFDIKSDEHYGVEIRTIGRLDTSGITTSIVDGKLVVNADEYRPKAIGCFLVCPFGPTNIQIVVHAPSYFNGGAGDTSYYENDSLIIDVPTQTDAGTR